MKPCEVAIRTTAAVLLGLSTLAPAPSAQASREIAKLVAPDGAPEDWFGRSVAIDGDVALVGARGNDELAANAGAAYVYIRFRGDPVDGNSFPPRWRLQTKLMPSGGRAGDSFGTSVALDGGVAAVGVPGQDGLPSDDVGAVRVFARNAGGLDGWGEIQRLESPTGLEDGYFGSTVALDADLLVVGAPATYTDDHGAAFVYERRGLRGPWYLVAELIPSDPDPGYSPWWFGHCLALDGDTVVVSATDAPPHNNLGSVHVFERHEGGPNAWGEATVLVDPWGYGSMSLFGYRVDVSGDEIAVAAPFRFDEEVLLYSRNSGGTDPWVHTQTIVQNVPMSLALDGDLLLVASRFPAGLMTGAIFAYGKDLDGLDDWTKTAEMVASDVTGGDGFWPSLALRGHDIIAGADSTPESAFILDFTPAGSAAATFRNDVGGVNPASYTCDPPVIGESLDAVVDLTTTGDTRAALFGYDSAAEIPLVGGQVLLCTDLGGNGQLLPLTIVPGPQAAFHLPIPNDPRLFGFTLSTQALHFGGIPPFFALSNAQDLVVGYE